MIRDDAVLRIQQRLGFRSDLSGEIIKALQDAQDRLEDAPELPWFLLSEISQISTVDSEERVIHPSDFLREYEESALWTFDSAAADADKWVELAKDEHDFLRNKYPGEGKPVAYSHGADYFRLFPTPDAAYVLKLLYYKKATALTTNIENEWLLHVPWLLIGLAGSDIAGALRDASAEAKFDKDAAAGADQLIRDNEARKHTNRRYVMGGNN